MLTRTHGSSLGWLFAAVMAALVVAPGCGGTGDTGGSGSTCTPNQQVSCDCPGGTKGVQVCNEDGRSFSACDCGGSTGGGGAGGGTTGGAGGGTTGLCGNGMIDPGECETGEFQCPQDCMGTGGAGGGTTTSSNTCDGQVAFAALVPDVPSVWGSHPNAGGVSGYEAGVKICMAAIDGADHPCTYEEMKKSEAAGELAGIAAGTSVWIHRTTPETVNGQVSQPGAGGRCNNWVYSTNHISDGEYATFDQAGVPTYHLDGDTFFDGVDTTHTITGDLQCGGVMRSIICCYPVCVP